MRSCFLRCFLLKGDIERAGAAADAALFAEPKLLALPLLAGLY